MIVKIFTVLEIYPYFRPSIFEKSHAYDRIKLSADYNNDNIFNPSLALMAKLKSKSEKYPH